MVSLFMDRFATTTNQIRLADLAGMKPKPGETAMSYITRWRNMSVRASHSMPEKEAIELIIRNLSGKMKEWLSVANVNTYQELIDTVSRIGHAKLDEPATSSRQRNDFPRRNDAKAVYAVRNDNMNPSNEENKRVDNRLTSSNGRDNRDNRFPVTLEERKNQKYSFKREKTFKIFKQALEDGLELPPIKRPGEVNMTKPSQLLPLSQNVRAHHRRLLGLQELDRTKDQGRSYAPSAKRHANPCDS
jgi:vacuolar-type H+-ATPase subunit I/STV1